MDGLTVSCCYLEAQQQHVAGGAQYMANDHDDDDDGEAKNALQQI